MKEEQEEQVNPAKRDFLKKAAATAFTIPVIQSFKVGELHAKPHSNPGLGDGAGGGRAHKPK